CAATTPASSQGWEMFALGPSLRIVICRCPPTSPLFPYTPLFRSSPVPASRASTSPRDGRTRGSWCAAERAISARSPGRRTNADRSEEHTSELQSRENLVCRLLLEKKNYLL